MHLHFVDEIAFHVVPIRSPESISYAPKYFSVAAKDLHARRKIFRPPEKTCTPAEKIFSRHKGCAHPQKGFSTATKDMHACTRNGKRQDRMPASISPNSELLASRNSG